MRHKYLIGIVAIVIIPLAFGLLWLWVLVSPDPVHNPVATYFPWPIACSTQGCITTRGWHEHLAARRTFAAATHADAPTSAQALQTLARQHLSQHAVIRSPVTAADARRYREEILNVKNEAQLQTATALSFADYDRAIILPFLQQESLRQQRKVESTSELYQQLARERWIFVLPFSLGWNRDTAEVTTNRLYEPQQN